jgi:hypothetical protein
MVRQDGPSGVGGLGLVTFSIGKRSLRNAKAIMKFISQGPMEL